MGTPFDRNLVKPQVLIGAMSTSGKVGTAISGTYSFGVSGNCLGIQFVPPTSSTLTDVYFFVTAIAGTGGTATVELRNYSTTTVPGSTVLATTSVATGTASKWCKATFGSPATLVAGTTYYLVLTSNDGTNFATVEFRGGMITTDSSYQFHSVLISTNGFSTGTAQSHYWVGILAFGDGSYAGSPWTVNTVYTSNTRERGYKILGLDGGLAISGLQFLTGQTSISGLKIYDGSTAPGGTTLANYTIDAAALALGRLRFPPFTFSANTVYRAVLTFGSSSTSPGFFQIDDDTTYATVLEACGIWGGKIVGTIDNGSGGWTDSASQVPGMMLFGNQLSGGGGSPMVGGSPLIRLRGAA